MQQLLLTWLSPSSGKEQAAAAGTAAAEDGAEAMAVDGAEEGGWRRGAAPGAAPLLRSGGCCGGRGASQDEFVCCRRLSGGAAGAGAGAAAGGAGAPCNGRLAAGAAAPPANGCLYDRDLEEAGLPHSTKPPLRVSCAGGWHGTLAQRAGALPRGNLGPTTRVAWLQSVNGLHRISSPAPSLPLRRPCVASFPAFPTCCSLQEIYYFHQAIRSALHSFAAEARALRAAEGRVTTAEVRGASPALKCGAGGQAVGLRRQGPEACCDSCGGLQPACRSAAFFGQQG